MSEIPDSLQQDFERFVEFGGVLDRQTRKYLVQYLALRIDPTALPPPEINDQYYRYFSKALDELFAQEDLALVMDSHDHMAAQLVQDTLYWLRKAFKKVAAKTPYEDEANELANWGIYHLQHFIPKWQYMLNRLHGLYAEDELDLEFYTSQFKAILQGREYPALSVEDLKNIDILITDLLAQWDALLQAKRLAFQLRKMEDERAAFQEKMVAKAKEYRRLTDLVAPFTDYVGNYWDMSRELWQEGSFDVLAHYADLLEDEESVQRLVDLLGKLREAETELEEETFERTLRRMEWVHDPMMKSEVTGVHESNELPHMLPSEVALFADKNTESLFLQKYMEKSLLTLQYEDKRLVTSTHKYTEVFQRVKKKEKGPFILCVDTSGSMEGEPEHIAKVLAFAICKMAGRENRRAYLINFSNQLEMVDLLNLSSSVDQVAKFLQMSFHGGTDISLPLYEAMRQLRTNDYKDADVLIISDFIMYKFDERVIDDMVYHQQNKGTQFHSLILSKYPNERLIETLDNNWVYDPQKKGLMRQLYLDLKGIQERAI